MVASLIHHAVVIVADAARSCILESDFASLNEESRAQAKSFECSICWSIWEEAVILSLRICRTMRCSSRWALWRRRREADAMKRIRRERSPDRSPRRIRRGAHNLRPVPPLFEGRQDSGLRVACLRGRSANETNKQTLGSCKASNRCQP